VKRCIEGFNINGKKIKLVFQCLFGAKHVKNNDRGFINLDLVEFGIEKMQIDFRTGIFVQFSG